MNEITRPKGETLIQKMFAETRRLMRDLNAIDIGPSTTARYTQKMQSNSGSGRLFGSQVSRIPAKSSRFNDQCFDFDSDERNRYSTEYPETSKISNYFRNTCGRQDVRDIRSSPYHESVQNRASKREWAEGLPQSTSREWKEKSPQSMKISYVKGEPESEFRSVWKNNKPSTSSPKVTHFRSSTGATVKGYSNSSSSSWLPDGKNIRSSYQNKHQESNSASRYGDTKDSRPFNKRDMKESSFADKWDRSTNLSQNFENYNEYEDRFDDFCPKESATKKWDTPTQRNQAPDDGEFYAKVCDAVFEKVIELLHSDTYQVNQKSRPESLSSPVYNTNASSRYANLKTSSMRDNPFPSEISQRSKHPEPANRTNYFNVGPREYVSKPSFNQSFRGRSASRSRKRKFVAKN